MTGVAEAINLDGLPEAELAKLEERVAQAREDLKPKFVDVKVQVIIDVAGYIEDAIDGAAIELSNEAQKVLVQMSDVADLQVRVHLKTGFVELRHLQLDPEALAKTLGLKEIKGETKFKTSLSQRQR